MARTVLARNGQHGGGKAPHIKKKPVELDGLFFAG
jgi:hypothetical protein